MTGVQAGRQEKRRMDGGGFSRKAGFCMRRERNDFRLDIGCCMMRDSLTNATIRVSLFLLQVVDGLHVLLYGSVRLPP